MILRKQRIHETGKSNLDYKYNQHTIIFLLFI